jgi:hypothetical protein
VEGGGIACNRGVWVKCWHFANVWFEYLCKGDVRL